MDILTDSRHAHRLEIVDTGRRRRWSDAAKLRAVEESFSEPRVASATARRHGISNQLMFAWRKAYREGRLGDGARLRKLGEDVTETLEVIPRRWKVVQTVREKFTCRDCEGISQPPAPFHATPCGFLGPNLLATVLFDKFGQHLPLNRQSERYAPRGDRPFRLDAGGSGRHLYERPAPAP